MIFFEHKKISPVPKFLLTLFVLVLIPVYWINYGPTNFLWLSDIGLFLTIIALWLESTLLMSVAMIAIFPMEIVWNFDFFSQSLIGYTPLEMTTYMFDPQYSIFLRFLSLFHVIIPAIWLWYFLQWRYDPRALKYAIVLVWTVLLLTYLVTEPEKNINWVFSPFINQWHWVSPLAWLIILMLGFLSCLLLLHILLKRHFNHNQ